MTIHYNKVFTLYFKRREGATTFYLQTTWDEGTYDLGQNRLTSYVFKRSDLKSFLKRYKRTQEFGDSNIYFYILKHPYNGNTRIKQWK